MTPHAQLYIQTRDRIAPAVERTFALTARLRVLERGFFGAAADEAVSQVMASPHLIEARDQQIEALTLQVLAEAGIRPVMQ